MSVSNRLMAVLIALMCEAAQADLVVRVPERVGEHELAVITVESDEGTEIDVEIWKSLDESVSYRELKASSGREFCFVAPAGEYLVKVYGWKSSGVEKYSGKIVIGGSLPGPSPPQPVEPDDTLSDLAKLSRDAGLKVFSVSREAEAKALAQVYRSVSSQAAALSNMTAAQMTQSVREGNRKALSDEARTAWGSWASEIGRQLEPISEKPKLIEAYRAIAQGLESIK